jgi:predicted negative regulator of RcsB-dependent stress response
MVIIHKKHKETAQEKEARQQKEHEQSLGIQDQYQARGFELVSFIQSHRVLVGALIAIVVIFGALLSGYLYYQQRKSENASSAYLAAVKEVLTVEGFTKEDQAKREAAQTALIDVTNSYKGSDVAVLAMLYEAHLALTSNDSAKSVVFYKNALAQLQKSDPLFSVGTIGLGYAQEQSQDVKGALQTFESAFEIKNGLGKDLALYEAARLAKENQEPEKVKKYVARLLEEYPASVYEKNARKLGAENLH